MNPLALIGHWREGAIALLTIACLFLYIAGQGEARRADKWQAKAGQEAAAHKLTQADYRRVRAEQTAADAQHAREVEQAQAKISSEVSSEFQKQIANLRHRYDTLRVRAGAAAAHPGGGGPADMSGLPDPAGRPDAAAREEGLSGLDRFTCSGQAYQLEALQDWLKEQQAIVR